ncbi:protein of unknown function [Candidatus Bipolaricaulis anaerobius]|uniref:Uncharacterized protein n=1 Tax=Candidatus Bipolaricaulis anaerobius TaxID=2026885 RepID=A0A2X3L213_9BACT|nr:protein of unknown function [Candidatus Bipolaricaulis anaerobius]
MKWWTLVLALPLLVAGFFYAHDLAVGIYPP